jgi:hypothetical protein
VLLKGLYKNNLNYNFVFYNTFLNYFNNLNGVLKSENILNLDLYNKVISLLYDYYFDFLKGIIRFSYFVETCNLNFIGYIKHKLNFKILDYLYIPLPVEIDFNKVLKVEDDYDFGFINDLCKWFI